MKFKLVVTGLTSDVNTSLVSNHVNSISGLEGSYTSFIVIALVWSIKKASPWIR